MGYRRNIPEPPDPDDMLPVFEVANATTEVWSIPCYYLNIERPLDYHDAHLHDHIGWPGPGHPDHSCQRPWEYADGIALDTVYHYIDMEHAIPIHFMSDYETDNGQRQYQVNVQFDESNPQVDWTATIRNQPDDWIIDIAFNPTFSFEDLEDGPVELKFGVTLSGSRGVTGLTSDSLLFRGKLVVLPLRHM